MVSLAALVASRNPPTIQNKHQARRYCSVFFVDHHPYAMSLLLKISDEFKIDTFRKMGLEGRSKDWETLVTGFIDEWEEENSGVDLFHFDSDEEVFCVYSQYIDDISLFSRYLRAACNDEEQMRYYFNRGSQKLTKQN